MKAVLFAGWEPLFRIFIIGTAGYLFLLLTLRASGPRILAKTNIFDFIIAVTVGSVFGRVLTAKEVVLAEVCFSFALLAGLQFLLGWLRERSPAVAALVDTEPILIYFKGNYVPRALKKTKLTKKDVEEAIRLNGFGSLEEVEAVVLESGGGFSVLRRGGATDLVASLNGDSKNG